MPHLWDLLYDFRICNIQWFCQAIFQVHDRDTCFQHKLYSSADWVEFLWPSIHIDSTELGKITQSCFNAWTHFSNLVWSSLFEISSLAFWRYHGPLPFWPSFTLFSLKVISFPQTQIRCSHLLIRLLELDWFISFLLSSSCLLNCAPKNPKGSLHSLFLCCSTSFVLLTHPATDQIWYLRPWMTNRLHAICSSGFS